jgi:biopolymer transport protein ExbD
MRFLIRKRRTAPGVIIVALIDVLIVLVIFLLVTTTFKQQPSLRLQLPESTQARKNGANENPSLEVFIMSNGVVHLGQEGMAITVDQLQKQLASKVEKNPNLKLAVKADKNAPWGRMVEVMDAAHAANITNMSASTKEAGKP